MTTYKTKVNIDSENFEKNKSEMISLVEKIDENLSYNLGMDSELTKVRHK